MFKRTWFITGVSSGFGYEMAKQLLADGDTVIGIVRDPEKVSALTKKYPKTFDCQTLDLSETSSIRFTVSSMFNKHGKIDVIVSNAGYGLFGAAEEVTDKQIQNIIATNFTGSIMFIKACLPYLRRQGYGRIIQISSYAGQVASAGSSIYTATKFGIEGFCEALSKEVAHLGIGVSIIEPGDSRTEFYTSNAKVVSSMAEYDNCRDYEDMVESASEIAPGDPELIAKQIINSVNIRPAPLRVVLGSKALKDTMDALNNRLDNYKKQINTAGFTDF